MNFFLTMKNLKMSKKIDIVKFVHCFYIVEISKTIVFLAKQLIKFLLNNNVEICIITFKTSNQCDFFMRNDLKFHVINVIDDKFFFEKMCKNAKINLKNIIVRIFIFVIKNDDHDFIFETSYERKTMFSFKYFVDKLCEIIIYSQRDTKKIKFQTIAFNYKSNKTINFIFFTRIFKLNEKLSFKKTFALKMISKNVFSFSINVKNIMSIFSSNLFNHVNIMGFFKRFDLLNIKESNKKTKIFILCKKKVNKMRSMK